MSLPRITRFVELKSFTKITWIYLNSGGKYGNRRPDPTSDEYAWTPSAHAIGMAVNTTFVDIVNDEPCILLSLDNEFLGVYRICEELVAEKETVLKKVFGLQGWMVDRQQGHPSARYLTKQEFLKMLYDKHKKKAA